MLQIARLRYNELEHSELEIHEFNTRKQYDGEIITFPIEEHEKLIYVEIHEAKDANSYLEKKTIFLDTRHSKFKLYTLMELFEDEWYNANKKLLHSIDLDIEKNCDDIFEFIIRANVWKGNKRDHRVEKIGKYTREGLLEFIKSKIIDSNIMR